MKSKTVVTQVIAFMILYYNSVTTYRIQRHTHSRFSCVQMYHIRFHRLPSLCFVPICIVFILAFTETTENALRCTVTVQGKTMSDFLVIT